MSIKRMIPSACSIAVGAMTMSVSEVTFPMPLFLPATRRVRRQRQDPEALARGPSACIGVRRSSPLDEPRIAAVLRVVRMNIGDARIGEQARNQTLHLAPIEDIGVYQHARGVEASQRQQT